MKCINILLVLNQLIFQYNIDRKELRNHIRVLFYVHLLTMNENIHRNKYIEINSLVFEDVFLCLSSFVHKLNINIITTSFPPFYAGHLNDMLEHCPSTHKWILVI